MVFSTDMLAVVSPAALAARSLKPVEAAVKSKTRTMAVPMLP